MSERRVQDVRAVGARGHERGLQVTDGAPRDPDVLPPVVPVDALEVVARGIVRVEQGIGVRHRERVLARQGRQVPVDRHPVERVVRPAVVRRHEHPVTGAERGARGALCPGGKRAEDRAAQGRDQRQPNQRVPHRPALRRDLRSGRLSWPDLTRRVIGRSAEGLEQGPRGRSRPGRLDGGVRGPYAAESHGRDSLFPIGACGDERAGVPGSRGLSDRRHHVPPAGLLGQDGARDAIDPRRDRERVPAALLVRGPRVAPCDQESPGHRGLAPAGPHGGRTPPNDAPAGHGGHAHLRRPWRVRGRLAGGSRRPAPSGAGRVRDRIGPRMGGRRERPDEGEAWFRAASGRSGRDVSAQPLAAPPAGDTPRFAHASERQFARLLDFYQIEWAYEPTSFDIGWDHEGNVVQRFTPDFYLPEFDLYIEITTLNQKLVTKKNRKVRRLRERYPEIRCKVFYQRDYLSLITKYGLEDASG